jgi:GntR family transcriptional regulator
MPNMLQNGTPIFTDRGPAATSGHEPNRLGEEGAAVPDEVPKPASISAPASTPGSTIERGPVPAYYQIYRILRERIASGVYPVNGMIPTDEGITREFRVSRHTARAAIQQLVAQGMVRRLPAKGTFVLPNSERRGEWGAQSLEDMLDRDFDKRVELHEIRNVPRGSTPDIAAALDLPPDAEIANISWFRGCGASRYAWSSVFVSRHYTDQLPSDFSELLANNIRLLHLLERHCGVRAQRVRQLASAVAADPLAASLLHVAPGAPLLHLRRTYFGRDARPIEHARVLCRPDLYQQTVELFRAGA